MRALYSRECSEIRLYRFSPVCETVKQQTDPCKKKMEETFVGETDPSKTYLCLLCEFLER
ncbi:hypothetical protein [Leptospira wolffii]|uniref:hypothetical protein n=1 Tax=Leptospira wolffii TaxID=409998 RepID=UPI0005905947|nr:hypothetical protein [Leptospira wolffii]